MHIEEGETHTTLLPPQSNTAGTKLLAAVIVTSPAEEVGSKSCERLLNHPRGEAYIWRKLFVSNSS